MEALLNPRVKELRDRDSSTYLPSAIAIGAIAVATAAWLSNNSSTVLINEKSIPELSDYALQLLSRTERMKNLQSGWDSYNADTISRFSIEQAQQFIRTSDRKGLPLYFAAPGKNGEVMVELSNKSNKVAEIYFNSDGSAEQLMYNNEECIYEGDLNIKRLIMFFNA